jgi:hypothetical protein
MLGWVVAAGLGSIALTALLTFVLWRVNAPMRQRRDEAGAFVAENRPDNNGDGTSGDGSNGGGGDSGGD